MNEKPETTEIRKRQAVFINKPKTILVKFYGMKKIQGIPKKEWDSEKTEKKHHEEAEVKGLNPNAYRPGTTDTGFCVINNETSVRGSSLLFQLKDAGYKYTGGHWQDRNGNGQVVTTLNFSLEGEEMNTTIFVREVFSLLFKKCNVWANQKAEGRLDTINLTAGRDGLGGRQLKIVGNTYRLE